MDDRSVNYKEIRYNEIKTKMTKILKEIRYNMQNVLFIPTSAWKNGNIRNKSINMEWYKGFKIESNEYKTGYTLYDAMNYFVKPRNIIKILC